MPYGVQVRAVDTVGHQRRVMTIEKGNRFRSTRGSMGAASPAATCTATNRSQVRRAVDTRVRMGCRIPGGKWSIDNVADGRMLGSKSAAW